ncbi:MAG: chemotaxis protein CheW [Myxococcota bacterium]|nr:purine-binding chemotaxis protein CheW [Myxococcales bacterium]
MATDRRLAIDEARVDLACFEVDGQVYALDVAQVREVVRCQEVTPLPKAPALIEGVIDLRGTIVPVLDLGRALGRAPVPGDDPRARIAIIAADGLVLGLRVAAAIDVLPVAASALEDPPELATQSGYDAVSAVVRRSGAGGAPVLVLSLDHILECVHRSSVAGAADVAATASGGRA